MLGGLNADVFLILAHADHFLDEHLEHVVAVLQLEPPNLLQVVDLYYIWVLLHGALLLLVNLQLLPLLNNQVLLLANRMVFRTHLLPLIAFFHSDIILDELKSLSLVVDCDVGGFVKDAAFGW